MIPIRSTSISLSRNTNILLYFSALKQYSTIHRKLFDEIPHRSVVLWNSKFTISSLASHQGFVGNEFSCNGQSALIEWTATISRLARRGSEEEAIETFKSMLLQGLRPNHVTVLSMIKAFGALDCEETTWVIHGFVIKLGFNFEVSIVTALLSLYSMQDMAMVWQLFHQVSTKDVVLWSALIAACLKHGLFVEAVDAFREMQVSGVPPNHVSVVSVLPACADFGVVTLGKQIHGCSMRRGFFSVINVQNSLVDMYAKCRDFKSSVLFFERIAERDLVSWNIMICGCMENGRPREALDVFVKMQNTSCRPDSRSLRNSLGACSQAKELAFGLGLHCFVIKVGLFAAISVGTALLRMYADFGDLQASRILYDGLHQKDFIAFSAMISIYAQAGYPHLALNTFKQMQLGEIKPNEITLVSLIQACSSLDTVQQGQIIHAHVLRVGHSSNAYITSALIDLYCKFGKLNQGKLLFDKLQAKDLICWSSMINGYGVNGCGKEALKTFCDMLDGGVRPNEVVFISILSACSHCGLENEGWWLFNNMESEFSVTPTLAHCACMVDMLSRRGRIEEAVEFINKMPLEPDTSIWGAVLAGCRATQGATELAELAAENLIRMDPKNTSYYIILSNLYAERGQWRDVERLRMYMKEKGFRKTAGYSMIETT
ncbi:hypothetical protein Sjap_000906 [Stephania japonica]|uniref:Pentatricopeptide repeat-containing protein n=1 Tax=Stephania japonica TaxID=461633 RepID=A0AAP0KJ00_9MAGN